MKVSIVVPVYNVKDLVIKCLESLHDQTLDDYEVIVVNDGSTDGSGELVEAFCADKEKFRVFHKENGGLASAVLTGISHAEGDYIGFVDSDDYIDREMYKKMMDHAENDNADVVMCNHWYVSSEEGMSPRLHRNPMAEGLYEKEDLLALKKLILPRTGADYVSPSRCSKVIRKDLLLRNVKFYSPKIASAEDVNMTVPCMLSCTRFSYIDEPLYYYVQRKNSVSYTFKEDILDRYLVLIENIKEAVHENGLDSILECDSLYNFFGISWCNYIMSSQLSKKEKKRQYQRLLDNQVFSLALQKISRSSGTVATIYKIMFRCRQPAIYELGNCLIHQAAKLLRKDS